MTYHRRKLDEQQSALALDPLRGLQPMRRIAASQVHATGDRVLAHGRRIVASVGLSGTKKWHIADLPYPAAPTKIYPQKDFARLAAMIPSILLTPGHFLRAVVVANPSGLCQNNALGPSGYAPEGADGQVQIVAIYNNPGVDVVVRTIDIPASKLANSAQPSGSAAAWSALSRHRTSLMVPNSVVTTADLAAWEDGVTVAVGINYLGSPRAVDVVVYEEPHELVYELGTSGWMAPMHASQSGGSLGKLKGAAPLIKSLATDAGGGAEIVTDAARRLIQEIGPILFFATSWDEGNQTVTSSAADYHVVVGATTDREAFTNATTAYLTTLAGASISSGANARRIQESDPLAVLGDRDNVVAVRCYIYGCLTAAGTATVRFETATYSIAELPIPSVVTDGWFSVVGHLRCGLGAQNPVGLQIRVKTSSAAVSFRWRYILVAFENV